MDKENETFFNELVTKNIISVEENRLKILNQIDITTYGAKAWAYTLQDIGKKKDKQFLYELGYLMAEDAAKELKNVIEQKKKFITKKLFELRNIIAIMGFGLVSISEENNKVIVKVDTNQILGYGKELYGNESLVCNFYRGVYSAFINIINNKNINLKEEKCICNGESQCIFTSSNV